MKQDWEGKHYSFYQNRECEFFPCHKGADEQNFNCLFCYCPLYVLGKECGGSPQYTKQGIKDCTGTVRLCHRTVFQDSCRSSFHTQLIPAHPQTKSPVQQTGLFRFSQHPQKKRALYGRQDSFPIYSIRKKKSPM